MSHDFLFYASAVAACVSLTGAFFNARRKWYSFVIWALANVFWVIYDLSVGAYFQAALFGCYLSMNVYGLYCWKFKKIE
ncbi:MAG: nicotinamide mononucleotide transporter family protein [Holosporaceae bacterium]|nr:nicotinamide mononucleotide transporter family protein [Holosporaceae bacterium]